MFKIRKNKKIYMLLIFSTLVLGLMIDLKSSDNYENIDGDALSHMLQSNQVITLNNIPNGDYLEFTKDQIIYMGTVWQNGQLPTKLTAYSVTEEKENWSLDLAASPLEAMLFENTLLVATANHFGKGHIVGINLEDGKLLWDQIYGDSIIAITSLDEKVWVLGTDAVYQIDPSDGESIQKMVEWESLPNSSDWRTITSSQSNGDVLVALSIGRDIYLYNGGVLPWELLWRFRAAKPIIELAFFEDWEIENKPVLLALSHSGAYAINHMGEAVWNVRNNDINRDGLSINCGRESKQFVFRNVLSGIYLMNISGVEASWELPGGSVKVLNVPMPIPKNPAFGLAVSDLDNDGIDEIIANSASSLFVFNCEGALLAYAPLNSGEGGSFVSIIRGAPRYSPVIINQQIIVAERGQVNIFTYNPNDER